MIFNWNLMDSTMYIILIVAALGMLIYALINIHEDNDALEGSEDYIKQLNLGFQYRNMHMSPEQLKTDLSKMKKIRMISNLMGLIPIILLVLCNISYRPVTQSKIVQAKVTNLSILSAENANNGTFKIFTKSNAIWTKSDADIYPGGSMIKYSDNTKNPQLQVKTTTTHRVLWSPFKTNRIITEKEYYLILPTNELK